MRLLSLGSIIVFFLTFSLFADISLNIPCKGVSVIGGGNGAVFTGSKVYGKPGQPALPVFKCALLLPPDADLSSVSLSVSDLTEEVLTGKYIVKPSPAPVSQNGEWWPKTRNIVDGKDIAIYSTNAFFPNSYIGNVSVGKLNCYKVAHVSVYLSQYNPITGKLKSMKNGILNVKYSKVSNYNAGKNAAYKIPLSIKKKVRKLVVNYNEMADAYDAAFTFTRATKYVIITTSDIQSSSQKLAPFISSKEARGFDMEVVTESTWGNSADDLRSWLQDNYQTMGIEYVLLIGDPHMTSGDVPMKKITYEQGNAGSDFYFAQLSGDFDSDGEAEVDVGRIPIYGDRIHELDAILEKSTAYENDELQNISWRTNALLIASPLDDQTPGSFMFENIKETFYDPAGWTYYRIYDDDYGQPDESRCRISAVVDAWNADKYGFIEYMCHGNPTLAQNVLNTNAIKDLSDSYNPFVFQGTCCNGKPTDARNLGYAVLKQCGIGVITATENAYYYIGQTDFENGTSIQSYEYELARAMVVDSLSAGSALSQVKSRGDRYDLWVNFVIFTLYGVPDLGVYTFKGATPINNNIASTGKPLEINFFNNMFHYQVPENGKPLQSVSIKLFNAQGKLISTLLKGKQKPGNHVLSFNRVLKNGQKPATGLYLCKIRAGAATKVINVLIQR